MINDTCASQDLLRLSASTGGGPVVVATAPARSLPTFASRVRSSPPTLELHQDERCPNAPVFSPRTTLRAPVLDRSGLVEDAGQQRGEFIPAFVVELQRKALHVRVLAVERAGVGSAFKVLRDIAQRRVGQRAAQGQRKLCPVAAADERRRERLVVVLDRAAPRRCPDEF